MLVHALNAADSTQPFRRGGGTLRTTQAIDAGIHPRTPSGPFGVPRVAISRT